MFVDTSAWIAIINPRDKHHLAAKEFYSGVLARKGQFLISNLIVAETYTNLLWKLGHHKAMSFLDIIEQSSSVHCVWSDQKLEAQARDILRRYDDQDFSYTDAVSFALMQQQELTEAFAFDHHFSVVGFVQLPAGQ
ncbi:MAG: PIN domain-containing protein [Chloroflexi bacterium]|nr:PIN domain-containing protein [Chloroflexota bacterium]